MHALVAVTAVTVQNSMGVKGFHEIPTDVIAGQIEAVASDIGVQAAKTGMLASSEIIATVAAAWRDNRLAGTVPFVVDPVCASIHGDPLLHPGALDSLRSELFPLATLVTPTMATDRCRRCSGSIMNLDQIAGVAHEPDGRDAQLSPSASCAKCGSGWLGGQHYFQYCSHSTVAKTVNDAV